MPNACRFGAHAGADQLAVLADAAGEDDGVEPAELDQQSAQVPADLGDEHVERQLRPGVARGGRLFQVADVAA